MHCHVKIYNHTRLILCSFVIYALLFLQPTFAQQITPEPKMYFSIPNPIMYENKKIPGFVQDIPSDFQDIISLHQANLDVQLKEINKAIIDVENALSITPTSDILILKSAILYYERKDYDKAGRIFENLFNRSAKRKIREDASFYLGLIAAQNQAYQECKFYFEHVITLNRKRVNAYVNLGLALIYLNESESALENFELALTIDPNDAIAYFYKGLADYKKGDKEKASLEGFRMAKRLESNDPIFQNWTDSLMANDKRIGKLLNDLKKNPKNLDTYSSLGWIYQMYGEVDKAEAYFKQALQLDPKYTDAFAGLSEVYLFKGDFKKAEDFAFKILKRFPERKVYVYSMVGRIRFFHTGDYKGAEEILKKAIELGYEGENYYPRAILGQLYLTQGKIKEAEEELEKIHQTEIDHTEINELEMKVARYKRIHTGK